MRESGNAYPILCQLCVCSCQFSCLADCSQIVLQDIGYSSPVVWNYPTRSRDGASSSDDNSDTGPDRPDRDRRATPPRTTADSPCAVRAQSVRSHAVTSSPFCDSAHMDAYAHGFPI